MGRVDCGVCLDGSGNFDSCMEIVSQNCSVTFYDSSLAECDAVCGGTECQDVLTDNTTDYTELPEVTTDYTDEVTTSEDAPTVEEETTTPTEAVATTDDEAVATTDDDCPESNLKKGIETCVKCQVYIDQRF
eukprot:GHVO01047692.1.p1 GENE.GHVO01047692.1~~GHVO01047692.1.p1  ORF type:complete len:132 (+),score=19.89 GHVO01047692.1:210-605(+)